MIWYFVVAVAVVCLAAGALAFKFFGPKATDAVKTQLEEESKNVIKTLEDEAKKPKGSKK